MMMWRRALLAVLACMLCGCAAGPAVFGQATGTVTGQVTVRACGGAYRIDDQNGCRINPAAGVQLIFLLAGSSERPTATTDANGRYRLSLKPGTYIVQLQRQGSKTPFPAIGNDSGHRYAGPTQVTVAAGRTVTADFSYTIELL